MSKHECPKDGGGPVASSDPAALKPDAETITVDAVAEPLDLPGMALPTSASKRPGSAKTTLRSISAPGRKGRVISVGVDVSRAAGRSISGASLGSPSALQLTGHEAELKGLLKDLAAPGLKFDERIEARECILPNPPGARPERFSLRNLAKREDFYRHVDGQRGRDRRVPLFGSNGAVGVRS